MATATPIGIRSLKNWEDAFENSVPQVRLIHRQLQNELAVNREKLRGLVSESYRDLLRTADKIIEMDATALSVENNLAEASRRCNWRLLEKKARSVRNFAQIIDSRDRRKLAFVAQLAVLQGCPAAISKLLHQGGSCILAAKVFVMSRILLKSLSEKSSLKIVSSLRDQLTTIRSLLLRHIDQTLKTTNINAQVFVEALCSLSLVKTSPPADLLRHFLYIRSNAISSIIESENLDTIGILNAFRTFDHSCRETETMFPKKISEALLQLKSKPLFHSPEFKEIPELNLDTNEWWLPEDIRGFIPWVRHDELELSRIHEAVRTWASRELELLYTSIDRSLERINNVDILAALRKEMMALLKAGNSQLVQIMVKRENPRQKFRDLLNERLGKLFQIRAEKLLDIRFTTLNLIEKLGESNGDNANIWARSRANIRISSGTSALKLIVEAAVHGHDRPVKIFLTEYNQWSKSVIEGFEVIRAIRSHGNPPHEFDEDEFDVDYNDGQESNEDADILGRRLLETLQQTYRRLEEEFERILNKLQAGSKNDATACAIFLLRAIREIRRRPPKSEVAIIKVSCFGKSLIKRLQSIIAHGVSIRALFHLSKALKTRKWGDGTSSQALWEGTPPLPVQPSPIIFNFLYNLVKDMAVAGMDLWTPATVGNLKGIVVTGISDAFGSVLQGRVLADSASQKQITELNGGTSNQESEVNQTIPSENVSENSGSELEEATTDYKDNNKDEKRSQESDLQIARLLSRSWAIQSIFDLIYLDKVLQIRTDKEPTILIDHVTNLELLLNGNIEKDRTYASAQEHWTRTQLLFSLLV